MKLEKNNTTEEYKVEFAYIIGLNQLGDFFEDIKDFNHFITNAVNKFLNSKEKNYEHFILNEIDNEKKNRHHPHFVPYKIIEDDENFEIVKVLSIQSDVVIVKNI